MPGSNACQDHTSDGNMVLQLVRLSLLCLAPPSVTPKLFLKNVAWMRKSETSRNTAGEVSTFAGQCESPGEHDGDSSEAQFLTAIQGVACLSNCSVLVTDPSSRSVRIIDVGEHCPQPAGKVPQTHSGE